MRSLSSLCSSRGKYDQHNIPPIDQWWIIMHMRAISKQIQWNSIFSNQKYDTNSEIHAVEDLIKAKTQQYLNSWILKKKLDVCVALSQHNHWLVKQTLTVVYPFAAGDRFSFWFLRRFALWHVSELAAYDSTAAVGGSGGDAARAEMGRRRWWHPSLGQPGIGAR